jgi:antitoxin component of MazEF toxin-antitoxin module
MFRFGKRNVVKQGGSFMIALPMQWMKSMDTDIKTVMIEMDSENQLRVIAGDTYSENTVS